MEALANSVVESFREELLELLKSVEGQELSGESAHQFIVGMQSSLARVGRDAFSRFVLSFDISDQRIERDDQTLLHKMVSEKRFLTPFGPVVLPRSLYQAARGGPTLAPLDRMWNMEGQFATIEVREAVLFSSAHLIPREVEELLGKVALFQPSATAIKHIVREAGEFIEAHRDDLDKDVRREHPVPQHTKTFVASMDGANVLLNEPGIKKGRKPHRPDKSQDRQAPSSYKNAMVGSFSFYDCVNTDNDPRHERIGANYIARMPEDTAPTFKAQFEQNIVSMLPSLPASTNKVLLFDAARPLWNYIDSNPLFDDFEKLVDFYHTTEHLAKAAEAIFGKAHPEGARWYERWRAKLKEDDAAPTALIRSLRYYRPRLARSRSRRKALDSEITFFVRNHHRMHYPDFRRRGLPIGSGPVEAACKTIVKQRLCRSGMRWSIPGGQHVLSIRCYVTSKRWDAFWRSYSQRLSLCKSQQSCVE